MLEGLYDALQAVLAYLYMPLSLHLMYQDAYVSTPRSMQLRITVLMILTGLLEIICGYLLKHQKKTVLVGSLILCFLWAYIAMHGKGTDILSLRQQGSFIHLTVSVIFTMICLISCFRHRERKQSYE